MQKALQQTTRTFAVSSFVPTGASSKAVCKLGLGRSITDGLVVVSAVVAVRPDHGDLVEEHVLPVLLHPAVVGLPVAAPDRLGEVCSGFVLVAGL